METKQNSIQAEFLRKLQLEYLTQKLRSMVYREGQYTKIAEDIAEKKATKIKALGIKFGIKTMFETGVDAWVTDNFWNAYGLPNLQYKDEEQKRVQGNYDAWYLLYRGTVVDYNGKEVTVVSNNPSNSSVRILSDGYMTLSYNDISLINDYSWE